MTDSAKIYCTVLVKKLCEFPSPGAHLTCTPEKWLILIYLATSLTAPSRPCQCRNQPKTLYPSSFFTSSKPVAKSCSIELVICIIRKVDAVRIGEGFISCERTCGPSLTCDLVLVFPSPGRPHFAAIHDRASRTIRTIGCEMPISEYCILKHVYIVRAAR